MSKPLFSLILTHHNQFGYVKEALDSVFLQNYENIELVFADDGSQDIDWDDLKDYVDRHKGENIKNVAWQINETNLGTTKNLNRAIKLCRGEYISFLAADDKLYDENVLTNFIKSFEICCEDVAMISAQADMMDDKLEKSLGLFVKHNFARDFNGYTPAKQYKSLAQSCFLSLTGGSCIKANTLKKYGCFNEDYRLVEDWSYLLHITRNGGKIKYFDFKALCHRDGGVSHYDCENNLVPRNVVQYRRDIVRVFEQEIFPYFDLFSYNEKKAILAKYTFEKTQYEKFREDTDLSDKPLFSVVLVHYSQPGYVKEALDSIFLQNYENIELVFADDGSQDIDLDDLKDYVYKHKGENIKNVVWQINETNLGTTKNLNRAIKSCSGKYLLFFAADDKLYDENVLTNFVKSFEKCPEDIAMISAQADMMDDKLEKSLGLFVKPNFARNFNSFEPLEQFKVFTKTCFLAIGASCMRLDMFKKYGYFNEEFKLVEDWSYFLHLTRNGGKIKYFDFKALCHRDGGTSHYDNAELVPQNVLDYKYDIIQIFEKEVFPYIESFSYPEKIKLVEKYDWEKADYASKNGKKPCMSKQEVFSLMPTFFVKRFIFFKIGMAPGKTNYYLDRLAKTALIWAALLLFDFFLLVNLQVPQNVRLLVNSLNLYVFPAIEIIFFLASTPYFLLHWLFKVRLFLKNIKK